MLAIAYTFFGAKIVIVFADVCFLCLCLIIFAGDGALFNQ